MSATLITLIIVAVIVVLYFISIYNRFVALKHNVGEAWSNIDVLLKQRYDELPRLVEVCKQYMAYESDLLERVVALRNEAEAARSHGDLPSLNRSEGALGVAVSGLLARAEAYPELKAADSFRHLLARVSVLEDQVADRREFYNEAVNINNIRREQFPDMIVAAVFRFPAAPLFEVEAAAREPADMKALFSS